MEGRDLRIKIALEKAYPDKNVRNISQKNKKLYTEIRNVVKERNIELIDYIKSLGFNYINGWKEELTEKEAINLLKGFFPDSRFRNVSDIAKNTVLYSYIRKTSKSRGIDTIKYLEHLGFKYEGMVNTRLDIYSICKLNKEYIVNMSELARILGTSRQNLDQKIKSKRKIYESWPEADFTENQIELVINVIKNRDYYYEDMDNGTTIKIFHSAQRDGKNAILYKDNSIVKFKFEIPVRIEKELKLAGFDKYEEQDMEIIKLIESEKKLSEIEEDEYGNRILNVLNTELKNKIITRASYLNMKYADYLQSIGFEVNNKRKYSDKDIVNLLSRYVIGNNLIKIPVNSRDYIRIFRIAKNRGYNGLEKFIEDYGFKYERIRYILDIDEKYQEIIKRNYIVEGNKIYINSLDPFYNRICSYSYKNSKSPDEYISQLGFERIKSPKELPENYKQFDWKAEEVERLKDVYSDNSIGDVLDKLANECGEVYLDTSSKTYWNLWKIANIRDMSINDLIELLGFKRLYAWDEHEIGRIHNRHEELVNDSEFIRSNILELQKIQGGLEKSKTTNEKIKRSRALVKAVKKLYHYKCQLCSNDGEGFCVPPIEKEGGELYVEVHHIIPMHEAKEWEDESEQQIDTYKNVIVVCSYHHKYLHYYHGGFRKIIEMDNDLYFESKLGDRIKIYTNHHLTSIK
ncbi:hypothetical protein HMPREF1982_00375 [Clostridiales bacterium oral taxon 876 str. F0540]|nr:hypothetical protein HMPREF1982_00375 [Clostridiales bacterium oral taxon 876 str. F0540]